MGLGIGLGVVGQDDLGCPRGGVEGGAANRGCREVASSVHARLEVDHARRAVVGNDDVGVTISVDVGRLC